MITLQELTYGFGIAALAGAILFLFSFTLFLILKCVRRKKYDKNDSGDGEPKAEDDYATNDNSEPESATEISDRIAVIINQRPDITQLILKNKANEKYGELVKDLLNKLIINLRLAKLRASLLQIKQKNTNNKYEIILQQNEQMDSVANELSKQDYNQMAEDDAEQIMAELMESELLPPEKISI